MSYINVPRQPGILRNPRIAQRELGIHTLARNPRIARLIPLLRTRDVEQTFDLSYFIANSCHTAHSISTAVSLDIGRSLKSFAAQLSLRMILKAARQSPETRSSLYSTKMETKKTTVQSLGTG